VKKTPKILAFVIFFVSVSAARAQQPVIGQQNGITWRGLAIGTPSEILSRKTFYVDGLDNMSAFWSQHADLKENAIDFNRIFFGMNVGQIRDGLDSFYVEEKNLQVPIIDAILVIHLQNAHIDKLKVESILKQLREATTNGADPSREKKIWQEALTLVE